MLCSLYSASCLFVHCFVVFSFISLCFFFFFFNDTATTEIYTLSLHDALPIFGERRLAEGKCLLQAGDQLVLGLRGRDLDRKSTRLNSSHGYISYAVFCLKKKKNQYNHAVNH